MKTEKVFPNGFTSWQETHFEVSGSITLEIKKDNPTGAVAVRHASQGHGGLYELAEKLTDEFELLNIDRSWDGEFYEELDTFLNEKLK